MSAKLSTATADAIVAELAKGSTLEAAASRVGVSRRSLVRWYAKGSDARRRREAGERLTADEGKHAAFAERVESGLAAAEHAAALLVLTAGTQDWRAAAWFLERRFPDRWGQQARAAQDLQRGLEAAARRLADRFGDRPELLSEVLEVLGSSEAPKLGAGNG